jgi:polar amino acid transport system substrate-binding protein
MLQFSIMQQGRSCIFVLPSQFPFFSHFMQYRRFNMKKQVAIYGLLMAALLALSACSAVQQAATSGGEAPAAAGKLGEIQAAGKLVVGTSADYPPYESIDADGNFVGFDMDLMRAIGEQLGVEVEFQDMPFDTLIASVQ